MCIHSAVVVAAAATRGILHTAVSLCLSTNTSECTLLLVYTPRQHSRTCAVSAYVFTNERTPLLVYTSWQHSLPCAVSAYTFSVHTIINTSRSQYRHARSRSRASAQHNVAPLVCLMMLRMVQRDIQRYCTQSIFCCCRANWCVDKP